MRAREIDRALDPAQLAAGWRGRGVAWLDGDGQGPQGRFSFVACEPVEVRLAHFGDPAPFALLSDLGAPSSPIDASAAPIDPAVVPWWIGYFAYDACWSQQGSGLRRAPRLPRGDAKVAYWARYEALVAFDHATGRRYLVGDDEAALGRLDALLEDALAAPAARARAGAAEVGDPQAHEAAILAALGSIAAGDIYQVNLARRWRAPLEGDPIALFLAMRAASPVPFGAYLEEPSGRAVLARTMERFLRFDARDRSLETRPIKGTIARAGDEAGERTALRADPKEHAEHAMIVDLMRNDLGRIAEIGSVRVTQVMEVEPYAALSHLVSTVRATARPGLDLAEIVAETFPPGSISGTPKLRAIERIEELEPHARGVYCGAIGHVDRRGGLSLAVAIRTATVADGAVEYFAGGGLVAASVPSREVAETTLKARVLTDALAMLADAHETPRQ